MYMCIYIGYIWEIIRAKKQAYEWDGASTSDGESIFDEWKDLWIS
jgi:hypothetical protein